MAFVVGSNGIRSLEVSVSLVYRIARVMGAESDAEGKDLPASQRLPGANDSPKSNSPLAAELCPYCEGSRSEVSRAAWQAVWSGPGRNALWAQGAGEGAIFMRTALFTTGAGKFRSRRSVLTWAGISVPGLDCSRGPCTQDLSESSQDGDRRHTVASITPGTLLSHVIRWQLCGTQRGEPRVREPGPAGHPAPPDAALGPGALARTAAAQRRLGAGCVRARLLLGSRLPPADPSRGGSSLLPSPPPVFVVVCSFLSRNFLLGLQACLVCTQ